MTPTLLPPPLSPLSVSTQWRLSIFTSFVRVLNTGQDERSSWWRWSTTFGREPQPGNYSSKVKGQLCFLSSVNLCWCCCHTWPAGSALVLVPIFNDSVCVCLKLKLTFLIVWRINASYIWLWPEAEMPKWFFFHSLTFDAAVDTKWLCVLTRKSLLPQVFSSWDKVLPPQVECPPALCY